MSTQKYSSPAELHSFIVDLLKTGEGTRVEFKVRRPTDDMLAKTLAALANTEGGFLVVGAKDDGTVLGEPKAEAAKTRERIRKIGESLLPGRITYIASVQADGNEITLVEVSSPGEGDQLVLTAQGQLWRRLGEATVLGDMASYAGAAVLQNQPIEKREVVVFVAMSFRTEEEPALVDYEAAMKRAASRSRVNIKLTIMNQVEGDFEISQELMKQIDKSDAVLADFTLSPRNVYFEAGYARGRNKTLIQTARKNTVLEFDVRNWRTLFFRNATELEELLVAAFDSLKTSNPIASL